MRRLIVLVFLGGALGAVLRELLMILIPRVAGDFPLDVLVANLAASFLLGFITGLYRRHSVSGGLNLLIGTGIAGGLSTFSSFAYGTVVLMSGPTADALVAGVYVASSLLLGYLAVVLGLRTGERHSA